MSLLRLCPARNIQRLVHTYQQPLRQLTNHSRLAFAPRYSHSSPPSFRVYRRRISSQVAHKKSGNGLFTGLVLLSIAIGGAVVLRSATKEKIDDIEQARFTSGIDLADFTDSFLIMASNTPAGRPGTLTPEQEGKLRELWALTMKVFGAYESTAVEANGAETPADAASEVTESTGGKKDKKEKKSRLHVFKRNKDKGEKDQSSAPASGTATPSDLSSLSLADEDDKHGLNKEFKAALANTSPEDLRKAFWSMVKCDHPDALLLRFLRARKWDVEKALIMMISTMHWRLTEMHVDDDIINGGELKALQDSKSDDPKVKKEGEDFLAQLRMGKSFLHGIDKEGRPMCIVRARLHRQGEQTEQSLERFTVYTIETARMLLRSPVDTATIVFDMTGFSMANMDYAPVKFMIKCFEANYPESLGTVLVYKAPWVFNAIWNIIRGWLDPVVAGKVHFCKTIDDLEAFVPRSQIPSDLGGDEKWEYAYTEPVPEENAAMKEETARDALLAARKSLVDSYESTILEWVLAGPEGEKVKSLEERRKERDTTAEALRVNYWKLDPYVRAKTLYDRTGIINEDGRLEFYPSVKKEKENVPPVAAAPVATKAEQETSPDDLD